MAQPQYLSKQQSGIIRERKSITVERELDRIYERDGVLTPEQILEEASQEKSNLHGFFEWDDSIAGEKYRLVQARNLIMATKYVVVLNKQREAIAAQPMSLVRKFPSAVRGEGFRMRNDVLNEKDARGALIASKLSALKAWCRGVVDISELNALRGVIEQHLQ